MKLEKLNGDLKEILELIKGATGIIKQTNDALEVTVSYDTPEEIGKIVPYSQGLLGDIEQTVDFINIEIQNHLKEINRNRNFVFESETSIG